MIGAAAMLGMGLVQPLPVQDAPRRPTPRQQPAVVSLEDLAGQGFEIKTMEQYGGQPGQFIVLLQRMGEVRSCLMRIERREGQGPQRRSVCF